MIPDVSVIMPLWRADPVHFREALASVLGQTLANFELIIIEDASDQPGGEVIRAFSDPRVRHVENSTRTSTLEAHNRGLSLARAPLIALFDADDVCEPDRLRRQKEFLDRNPGIGGVGSAIAVIDATGRPIGIRRYPTSPEDVRAAFRRFNPLANPAVMFRRSLVEEYGGWTPGSSSIATDYEWFSRLAAGGVSFANFSDPLIRYRLHDASLTRRKVRATLRTTWEVKRTYWLGEMTLLEKALMLLERALMLLPSRLVLALFRRIRISSAAAGSPGLERGSHAGSR